MYRSVAGHLVDESLWKGCASHLLSIATAESGLSGANKPVYVCYLRQSVGQNLTFKSLTLADVLDSFVFLIIVEIPLGIIIAWLTNFGAPSLFRRD